MWFRKQMLGSAAPSTREEVARTALLVPVSVHTNQTWLWLPAMLTILHPGPHFCTHQIQPWGLRSGSCEVGPSMVLILRDLAMVRIIPEHPSGNLWLGDPPDILLSNFSRAASRPPQHRARPFFPHLSSGINAVELRSRFQ